MTDTTGQYRPAAEGRQHVTLRSMNRETWRKLRMEALARSMTAERLINEILLERYKEEEGTH